MSSYIDAPDLGDGSSRLLPKSPVPNSTRKAPPSPLATSPSSLSPHSNTPKSTTSASLSTPNGRNSLESSRLDLVSLRSDLTSLRCSEFPIPPLDLPPIPASPLTPRSLYFSATPTTPRSQSPHSGYASQQQDHPSRSGRSLLGSPKSLKGFLSSSRSRSPHSKSTSQQPHIPEDSGITRPPGSPGADLNHGYDVSRLSVPAHYSQYAVYKESNISASASQPPTPTTTGTMTLQDWQSSSGRTSPLLPPRPVYASSDIPVRSHSPLRHGSSFATQQDECDRGIHPSLSSHNQSPTFHSRSTSPQPPRSPLPVPPSQRSSTRDSARYSHIARKAGVTDMGMDISEEQLLSTDFITEMLKQPMASSPLSAQLLRLPDSPRSPAFSTFSSDDTHGLSGHVRGSEMRLAPEPLLDLSSPGFLTETASVSEMGQQFLMVEEDHPGPHTPDLTSPSTLEDNDTHHRIAVRRIPSSLASSIFPSGGDRIYLDGPSPIPITPDSQSLTVSEHRLRSHGSPHPLVPSTPMSPESFVTSSGILPGFAQAQVKYLPSWRKSSTKQTVASLLPIGRPSSSGVVAGQKTLSPRITSPRVRQHHYPRNGATKRDLTEKGLKQNTSSLPSETFPVSAADLCTSSVDLKGKQGPHVPSVEDTPTQVIQTKNVLRSNVMSNAPSSLSHTSSTRTQRDSSTTFPRVDSPRTSPDIPYVPDVSTYTGRQPSQTQAHRSYESDFLPSESEHADDEYTSCDIEGEVQTASRVLHATASALAKNGDETGLTVVGMAPAVIIHQKAVDSPVTKANTAESQIHRHLDASSPISGFEPDASPPLSPREPPSIHSPPSHRTDIPESAKSVPFSDEVHGANKSTYLPYDEVAGYGFPNAFWNVYPDSSSNPASPRVRPSNHAASFKSFVSYLSNKSRAPTVTSRITKASHKSNQSTASSRWAWLRRKPLPPLPPPSQPSDALDHLVDGSFSLPVLGQDQYQRSKVSLVQSGKPQGWSDTVNEKWSPPPAASSFDAPRMTSFGFGEDSLKMARRKSSRRQRDAYMQPEPLKFGSHGLRSQSSGQEQCWPPSRQLQSLVKSNTRRLFWCLLTAIAVLVVLGAALGTTLRKHRSNESSNCDGNKTGVLCNLDATCTCPSLGAGTCSAPLAQALDNLVPVASQLFTTNFTSQALALILWESQGTPVSSNCAFQAELVDVGSVLDDSSSPNRTRWAQAALLWNLFQSGDINATRIMQSAVDQLPFRSLHSDDGIEADPSDKFTVSSLGYTFNFANQTVNVPTLSFENEESPPSQQTAEINSVAGSSLSRMYSFASAASTQRQAALSTYWRSMLRLDPDDLPAFIAAFKSADILLPFDATSAPGGLAISELLGAAVNRTLSFPPPIGCYPGLSSSQLKRISEVETQAFGLPAIASPSSSFDSSCFASHPVYGTLDILRTRLPFDDSRGDVAKQASVLASAAAFRTVLHAGELLSALPAANYTDLSPFDVDPRQFGTLLHLNHIALEWLQLFPTPTLAAEAAQFILSSPSSPPPPNSSLFNSTSVPTVEVAVFGTIFLPDVSSFVSSFSTPSGGLFFGSPQAQAFRRWALQQSSPATIAWSESTFATQTVREGSPTNTAFEKIWSAAGSLAASPTNSSSVETVVAELRDAGLFSA